MSYKKGERAEQQQYNQSISAWVSNAKIKKKLKKHKNKKHVKKIRCINTLTHHQSKPVFPTYKEKFEEWGREQEIKGKECLG